MQFGIASRWLASGAAVRPGFVVVSSPDHHDHPGIKEGLEPALVQVLAAEIAVEALDVAVLYRAPRLDEDVADTM